MSRRPPQGQVRAVLVGQARPYTRPGSRSAIDKQVVMGPVPIGPEGLAGDEQGDRRVHGGPDKAVHCYPWAHHAAWQREQPGVARWQQPGAMGENLSIEGLDEASVCLGDQWRIGTARVEVSQGRQPCWKLNDRFGVPDMAQRVQDSLRTGWYLRVLQPGVVAAGDRIDLLVRPHPHWPLTRLLDAIASGTCQPALLDGMLALPLPASWRKLFQGRRETGRVEDWGARLQGPPR